MIAQEELSATEIRATRQEVAQAHLPFEVDGYLVTEEMIYDIDLVNGQWMSSNSK